MHLRLTERVNKIAKGSSWRNNSQELPKPKKKSCLNTGYLNSSKENKLK